MKTNDEIKTLTRILGSIALRRRTKQQEFRHALKHKLWSQLAGHDGIDIGLLIAEQIVKAEIKNIQRNKPT